MPRLEPVAVNVKEALVGPVTRGDEEDEEEYRAVNAGSVEKVGKEEEGDDKSSERLAVILRVLASWSKLELTVVTHW